MALLTKPNMQQVWASGGDIVEPSDLKKQQGWTVEVPPHQFENWIQNRQDEYLAHINQRGIPAWDGLTNYEAGGLSYVQGSDGKVYKSVAASGPSSVVSNPTTDGTDTYWTVAFADVGAFLTQAAGDTRYTQRSNNLSDLTNTATARANIGAAPIVSPSFTGSVAVLSGVLEIGRVDGTASPAFIDFHSGATATDYDARIIAGAGDGTLGGASLQMVAKSIDLIPTAGGRATSQTPPQGANDTRIATTAFVQASTPLNLKTSGISGSFSNLKASATGTNASVTVTADAICLKNAANEQVVLNAVSVAPSLAASGANGLDTGTSAINTWYSVWVIWNGTTAAGLLSLSATAPTLPAGYTHKARVGWIRSDPTANKYPISFTQYGKEVQYKVSTGSNLIALPTVAAGVQGSFATPTWISASLASILPPTAFRVHLTLYLGAALGTMMAAPSNAYGAYDSATNPPPAVLGQTGSGTPNGIVATFQLEGGTNIFVAHQASSNVTRVFGWEDNL